MNTTSNINLIKTTSGMPDFLVPFQNQYRKLSIIVLVISVILGLIMISGYILLNVRGQALERRKTTLLARLAQQKTKETLFLAVKSRIRPVAETVATNHAKSKLLTYATDVSVAPVLQSVEEDDKNRILMNFHSGSVEESLSMADKVIALYEAGKIQKVTLATFLLDKSGNTLSFEYLPVWE
jgi:hypothetical protein